MLSKSDWSKVKAVPVRPGVTRKVFSGKNSMLTLNEIAATAQPNMHSHPQEQITIILKGRAEFITEDEIVPLKEGDMLLVPPNIVHGLRVIGSETVLNLDVFSPVRQDYL
jgi:quercetin dioxygenase-like cupin family protein